MTIPPTETGDGEGVGRDTTIWKVTFAPSTGCAGVAESVTRTTTGWKLWPTGSICALPATGCSRSEEAGTAVAEKISQGLFPGATQALTWTSPPIAAKCSVLPEKPLASVVALEELSVPEPFTT